MECGKFKLTYFKARGKAEIIRMILSTAGKEFEDVRIEKEKWPEMKPTIPGGILPLLETPCGKKLNQSMAIARFLAMKLDLYAEDKMDIYFIERAIDQIGDVSAELYKIFFAPDEKKEEMMKAFCEGKGQANLKNIDAALAEKEGGFFIGSKVTLADLCLICLVDYLKEKCSALLEQFPRISSHYDAVLKEKPSLADWIKSRPETAI